MVTGFAVGSDITIDMGAARFLRRETSDVDDAVRDANLAGICACHAEVAPMDRSATAAALNFTMIAFGYWNGNMRRFYRPQEGKSCFSG
mmetsp:Transcript_30071/g.59537  ORF Transcript_30071/g.59537 Transcript_30071/m.59537 type:complete len:89 (-) Transcript_30071:72-338(-)